MRTTRHYVAAVCVTAAILVALLYGMQPNVSSTEMSAVAVLAALAVVAEMLTFALPRSSVGSIAFIPYLAAVMVVPSWPTVVAATMAKILPEMVQGRQTQKRIFNVAQLTVTLSVAVISFRALGGVGMLSDGLDTLSATTVAAGLPALAAFIVAFVVNSVLVQGVISLAIGIRFTQAIRENVLSSVAVDLLASPIVFLFAWVYAQYGAIAAFAVWAPILGFRQLSKTTLELERTNQELLQLMVKSIEARDPYTSGHSRRVEQYAIVIARAMGLPSKDVERVGRAALLHDVGKIYEKYAPILAKPDKLSPDEWVTMQQHPIDGAELVGTMTRLRELIPAIRHHHEKWDGSGYPDAIAEQAIPLEARIIALADTIDAMSSERPYRTGMSAEQVRAEIMRCRGRHFDPQIVDRLFSGGAWEKIFAPDRQQPAFGDLMIVAARRQA